MEKKANQQPPTRGLLEAILLGDDDDDDDAADDVETDQNSLLSQALPQAHHTHQPARAPIQSSSQTPGQVSTSKPSIPINKALQIAFQYIKTHGSPSQQDSIKKLLAKMQEMQNNKAENFELYKSLTNGLKTILGRDLYHKIMEDAIQKAWNPQYKISVQNAGPGNCQPVRHQGSTAQKAQHPQPDKISAKNAGPGNRHPLTHQGSTAQKAQHPQSDKISAQNAGPGNRKPLTHQGSTVQASSAEVRAMLVDWEANTSAAELEKKTCATLKEMLKCLGLPVYGNKIQLINQILQAKARKGKYAEPSLLSKRKQEKIDEQSKKLKVEGVFTAALEKKMPTSTTNGAVEHKDTPEEKVQEVARASSEIVGFMINFCSTFVDGSDEDGVTALMLASKHGLKEIVSVLCEKSDLNAKTKEGLTALMEAALSNRLEALEILLSAGADINSTNNERMNALMFASAKGNAEIVRYLLSQNATIDACNISGDTALMLAVQYGDEQTIRLLLEKGAALTSQNSEGLSALLIAAKSNLTVVVSMLLKFNPEQQLDIQDINGETALMVASRHGYKEIVSILLLHGANAWKQNHQGFTAKFLANQFGHMEIEDIIYMWERENRPKLEQKPDHLSLPMTIEQFLDCSDLTYLTEFFVDNVVMETVSEFKSLNQRRRDKIETQLISSELEMLNKSLAKIGIIIKSFQPRTTDRERASIPAHNAKTGTNDVPS